MFVPNKTISMKKIVYLVVIVFAFATLVSCGSKKKGCGLTADTASVPSQEILVSEVAE